MATDKKLRELLIPIAEEATRELGKCADSWTDSDMALLQAKLPLEYHAYPLDELRKECINIRKSGKYNMRLNGHGPGKGSRKQLTPEWYKKYLDSPHWKEYRQKVLAFWEYRCTDCESHEPLDVHHRHYRTLGRERITDCIALCRRCHDAVEERMAEPNEFGGLFAE